MKYYSFAGVHLLPNHPFPYRQRTYAFDGIELEDIGTVFVCDLCGNEIYDISASFDIYFNFNDPDNGLPQIIWTLKNVYYDFGYRLVYLKIQGGANSFIYSSPFMLTSARGELVSRWDYRNTETTGLSKIMLSTGLAIYFRQKKSKQETSNYNPVNSNIPLTASTRLTPMERWNTDVVDINIIEVFKEIFLCNDIYSLPANFDGLPVKTGLFEPFDTPDLEADENFTEQEILLIRNYGVTFDPNAPIIVPPIPVPPVATITLISVQSLNNNQVKYTFSFANFAPEYLTYQYSLDQVNWVNATNGVFSPITISVDNNQSLNYYYRIFHNGTGVTSNVLQLPQPSILITNIVSPEVAFIQTGNKYSISFTLSYNPSNQISFEASTNGTDWYPLYYSNGNTSPKSIQTPSSGQEFKFFRIKDNGQGIISNVYQFQF